MGGGEVKGACLAVYLSKPELRRGGGGICLGSGIDKWEKKGTE